MEQPQLTVEQAFQVVYDATGQLTLNRKDSQLLDMSLRVLAQLLPKSEASSEDKVTK